jgi:hypothetical protein
MLLNLAGSIDCHGHVAHRPNVHKDTDQVYRAIRRKGHSCLSDFPSRSDLQDLFRHLGHMPDDRLVDPPSRRLAKGGSRGRSGSRIRTSGPENRIRPGTAGYVLGLTRSRRHPSRTDKSTKIWADSRGLLASWPKVVRILYVYWNASSGVRSRPVTIADMAKMADFSPSNRTPPDDA